MATQEKTWNVANRLHSQKDSDNPEVNHIIAGADEIYDDAKGAKQSDINAQTDAALADRYTKADTYSKEQLDSLITTPDVNYVSVVATNATTAVTDVLPATGEANTIYRVGNWNGTQYDPIMYALCAWNGTTYVCLAVRSFVGEVYDVSVNHPDGQGNPTPYPDLVAALGTDGANIPADIRRGGMRIQFIKGNAQSSDNKYVQYFLTKDGWSMSEADWQKLNLEEEVSQLQRKVTDIDSVLPRAAKSYTGRILEFDGLTELPTISGSNDITIAGRNLFNATSIVAGKIKNGYGVEVDGTGSTYFATFIPAYGGKKIVANRNFQRLYFYTPDKQWIGRTGNISGPECNIPATYNNQVVGFVQIQILLQESSYIDMMVNYGDFVLPFESYKSNLGDVIYPDYSLIYSNDMSEITVTTSAPSEIQEKLVSGDNIKTINGQSLLGAGDIPINLEIEGVYNEIQQTSRFFEIINNGDPIIIPSEVIISGRNLFDYTSRVVKKVRDDFGVEVTDENSNYFATFIPAYGGIKLSTNENLQRIYYYTPDKQWIGRSSSSAYSTTRNIPSIVDGQEVGWIQIQVARVNSINLAGMMVNYGDSVASFEEYKTKTTSPLYDGYNLLYKDDLSPFTVTIKTATKLQVPGISIPTIYEPETVDDGYSSPIGKSNTIRVNWSAEDKYTYYEFLSAYYDKYLGGSFGSGYSVRKKSLGNDCSNLGYEMFEYDFCPANYTRVVMLSAGMNTNETSGIWGVATFMRCVMEDNETVFTFLRENVRFIVLPIICPSSFDQPTLKYSNYNNVRINKNFNNKESWNYIHTTYPSEPVGEYPDSEAETQNLKKWINKYSGIADLYIDCHSDDGIKEDVHNYNTILTQVICSDLATRTKLVQCFPALVSYYTDKGYIGEGVTARTESWVESGVVYPKTLYAKQVCQIPAIMIEQYISSTMYGSDGKTNNDTYGIKNYVAMLRLYIMTILQENEKIVPIGDVPMNGYRVNYK